MLRNVRKIKCYNKKQTKIQNQEKEAMSDQKDPKPLNNRTKQELIIEYCRQKFINILPNSAQNRALPQQHKSLPNPQSQQLSKLQPIIYKKEQVKQVMRQLSIFLQLVIQNCLLSSDTRVRAESYRILGNFRNYLSRDLEEFETMIYNRNKSKLPFFEVDCRDFMNRQIDLKIPPQVSLYQDPLLFYIYTRYAQDELFATHPIHVSRQQRIEILKHHVPFLDPLLIPIVSQRLETKSKFSQLQDRLLMIMLKSKLDICEYRPIYFPNRNDSQIKNRIKNLSGHTKQQNTNPIKQIRAGQYLPLTESEIEIIFRGFQRFSGRWPVIAKYYSCRSGEFLQMQYTQDIKLLRRRQKQERIPQYISLKTVIDQRIQEMNKKKQSQPMDLERLPEEVLALDEEKHQDHEQNPSNQNYMQEMDSEPIDEEPQYKIINHLTFEYCEI